MQDDLRKMKEGKGAVFHNIPAKLPGLAEHIILMQDDLCKMKEGKGAVLDYIPAKLPGLAEHILV